MTRGTQSMCTSRWSPIAALALLAGLSHLPSLTAELVWDDVEIVAERGVVRSVPAALRGVASFRPWRPHETGRPRHRPLRDLSLAIDHTLWGRRPLGYHLTNCLLHAAAVCLAFWVLGGIGLPARIALVAAAAFAVHPALAETVSQIKNRGDIAATVACLLSLGVIMKARCVSWAWPVAMLIYALALLCAEWAVAAPAVFMLALWLGRRPRYRLAALLPQVGLAVAFAYWAARGAPASATGGLPQAAQALRNLLGYAAMGSMLGRLSPGATAGAVGTLGAAAALAGIALAAWMSRAAVRKRLLMASLWAVVAIAPACAVTAQISGRPIAGHRLYFAGIGVGLALAALCGAARSMRPGSRLAFAVLVLVTCLPRTMEQHWVWASSRAFWQTYLQHKPDAALACQGLANVYTRQGRLDAGQRELRRALTLARARPDVWSHLGPGILSNLGLVALKQDRPDDALALFEAARKLGETSQIANSLGIAYERAGRAEDAFGAYKRALRLDPTNVDAHHSLGNFYSKRGHAAAAAKQYEAAIGLDPQAVLSHLALGRVHYHARRLDAARRCFEAALHGPALADAHALLGLIAHEQGRDAEARRHLQLAMHADRLCWYAHLLDAEIAESLGDTPRALAAYRRILKLKPDQAAVRERVRELERQAAATRRVPPQQNDRK